MTPDPRASPKNAAAHPRHDRAIRVGLLGEGITASLTPPMHRQEALLLGLDYEYRVIDIAETGETPDDLPRILDRVLAQGYDAINVTHPFKQRVIDHIAALSPSAERLGAVNLIEFGEAGAVGHNTDWIGYRDAVEIGIGDVRGRRVVQVGAGGAGSATAYALLSLGVGELAIADADAARASELLARLAGPFPGGRVRAIALDELPGAFSRAHGVVHATPTGMALSPGLPFDPEAVNRDAWISEVVYLPLETQLLRAATVLGHRVLDGGMMAVGQAYHSLRIITGLDPDRARMRAHFLGLLDERSAQLGSAPSP
ncbi:shikimate dehydrogenase [Leucobacter allii]|uniref:Shikimate dehydrogenase n=1 Tax=Leucobacter allii TaxID=2932247 RepID=A0ABY4FML2_9MICO|nr:shikimate dehydrogenase [Leucobacter allii]UOQ57494.1 shikimate dehydrogenase [Leucobacter allii]UOR01954.1 shikimate dehydrogenase [Leucobacter allii]